MEQPDKRPSRAQRAAARSPCQCIVRSVSISRSPSRRLLQAIAPFGLAVSRRAAIRPARPCALQTLARIASGSCGVIVITGASGSGKSTLLRALAKRLRTRVAPDTAHARASRGGDRTLIDALALPLPRALAVLARCGLADAALLPRMVRELSDGERARYCMSRALASRSRVIFMDEFASVLDRVTARAVCCSLAACMRSERRLLVVATAHADVVAWLSPVCVAVCDRGTVVLHQGVGHGESARGNGGNGGEVAARLRPRAA